MKGQLFSAETKGAALSTGLVWYKWTGLEAGRLTVRESTPAPESSKVVFQVGEKQLRGNINCTE